tara:strand:+ start:5316 stop:5561 length:246 start_codon:yes stop_codon:yes gene_type:complete
MANNKQVQARNFAINEELANAIFRYLSGKPYEEVKDLVRGLESLTVVTIVDETQESSKVISPIEEQQEPQDKPKNKPKAGK